MKLKSHNDTHSHNLTSLPQCKHTQNPLHSKPRAFVQLLSPKGELLFCPSNRKIIFTAGNQSFREIQGRECENASSRMRKGKKVPLCWKFTNEQDLHKVDLGPFLAHIHVDTKLTILENL